MKPTEMVELLKQHEVFASLNEEDLKKLESIVASVSYKENQLVFAIGSMPNYLYYVKEGSFTLDFPNNESMVLAEGELIGELGLLNGDFRLGTLKANEDSKVISICGRRLFEEPVIPPKTSIKILRQLGKRITNYFRASQQMSSKEMILEGESDTVEFKSSLRWNIHAQKRDKSIEFASLKTIAAFINTSGGHLLIGINDDGEPVGLKKEQFENNDKMLLHLTNLIKTRIGTLFMRYIHLSVEEIDAQKVLRVDCFPAEHPAYLTNNNDEYFFIRTGPSTTNLAVSKIYEYIKERFR